jgi:hypothetical protein
MRRCLTRILRFFSLSSWTAAEAARIEEQVTRAAGKPET